MDLEDIASVTAALEPTKRAVVSLVGQFYDPLGLLSPVVVQFKVFLQEMCKIMSEWQPPSEVASTCLKFEGRTVICGSSMLHDGCS